MGVHCGLPVFSGCALSVFSQLASGQPETRRSIGIPNHLRYASRDGWGCAAQRYGFGLEYPYFENFDQLSPPH
jgi:hypothetical protein